MNAMFVQTTDGAVKWFQWKIERTSTTPLEKLFALFEKIFRWLCAL